MSDANANREAAAEYINITEMEADAVMAADGFMDASVDLVTEKLEPFGDAAQKKIPNLAGAVTLSAAIVYLADRIGSLGYEVRDGLGDIAAAIRGKHEGKGQS